MIAWQHKYIKTKKGKKTIVFNDKKRHEIDSDISNWEEIDIPCGQCINCRLQRSKEWSIRLMYELEKHPYAYFLTLTYDDEHLPKNGSLVKKDMQEFIKRWRGIKKSKYRVVNLKYYYCGEYGDNYERPHYHMIAYMDNFIPGLKYHSYNNGNPLYTSQKITELWGNGYVLIGNVTQESRQYVSGYINKKILGKGAYVYDEKGILPPYTDSSNGLSVLTRKELEKIYEYDKVYVAGLKEIKSFKPPKNFDKQFEEIDPKYMKFIKEKRKENAINQRENEYAKTTLYAQDYRDTKRNNFDSRYTVERNRIK